MRLALPLRDFYAGDSGVAMLDYLRILNALRLRREPPGWLMWAILSRAGHPAQRYPILWDSLADAMPLFGHAARAVLAVHPEPVDELPLVLEWLALVRPELDKLQRRAGWPWLVAQGRAWRDLRCLEIEAEAVSRSTPFVRMPVGTFEMVGLRSVRDLWDEARHMHHCADRFAGKCAAGFALVVSVRSGANPERRVATALYEQWAGQWELTQVRGVANRGATHEAEEAAAWLQRILNAPRPWPPEAELELGTRARVGEPRAGKAPRCMPPNARLVVAVTWSWSPMHSRRVRYQISGNRDRSLWLLWERCFDDNYGRWEPARLVAHVSRSDLGESAAAVQMLAACWRREIAEEGLDGFHEIAERGIVTEDELERVAEALWPTQSP